MADNIEHQDKGELVANCDQLQNDEVVVTTPVESRIMSIRGKQIMIDRDLAEALNSSFICFHGAGSGYALHCS